MRRAASVLALLCVEMPAAFADEPEVQLSPDDQLAQQLNNPIANLISVPIQTNFDYGGGRTDRGFRYSLVAQPVLPFRLNDRWNLITRTVIPFAHVDGVFSGPKTGLGDTLQAFWFSPQRPTSWGLTWGVGPAVLYPTATSNFTGSRQPGRPLSQLSHAVPGLGFCLPIKSGL